MICIRGKRGRPKSVIPTPEVKAALDLLVDCRQFSQPGEPLSFCQADWEEPMEGKRSTKELASEAALEYPERIGSINMRKYIATVVQVWIFYW